MTTYRRASDAGWRVSLRGVVVLGPNRDEVQLLAPPGDAVWKLLGTPRTIDELVGSLIDTFNAPESTIRADVETLVAELTELGLVEPVSRSGRAAC